MCFLVRKVKTQLQHVGKAHARDERGPFLRQKDSHELSALEEKTMCEKLDGTAGDTGKVKIELKRASPSQFD